MIVTFPQNWTAIMGDPTGATCAPVNYAQATDNLRYCLAVGLHDGIVYLEQFDDAHLHNPAILDTARRITPRPDAEFGRIFELHVDYPRGSPPNPATREELEAKFEALAAPVLPTAQVATLKERIFALEEVRHIGELTSLLSRA
jgi:2-methylcitrate dehydratase PrpD